MKSAEHPICKNCIHRWPQEGHELIYQFGQWCYMFMSGEHVEEQGYCGQFRRDAATEPQPPDTIAS